MPPAVNETWIRALQRTAHLSSDTTRTLGVAIKEAALAKPDNLAFIGETEQVTYRQLAERIEHYIGWAHARGLKKGSVVAVVLDNQPDYAAIWIGLSRIGVIVALINPQLRASGLAHCLKAAAPSHLIVGAAFLPGVVGGSTNYQLCVHGAASAPYERVDLPRAPSEKRAAESHVALEDPALLIYTSGTTGLPKAAFVSHLRIMMWSEWFAGMMNARESDRLYNCLPMYHSIGGVVAVGSMLVVGASVIVRRKFSASSFWADVINTRATVFQYIGDLCHYLVAAPATADHRGHRLRLCIGNGLRQAVWKDFVERFSIPYIIEFYAATEGTFSLFNLEGRPGAIGRIPRFMLHRSPIALVRHDHETQLPQRGPSGQCCRCDVGEVGEALGLIADANAAFSSRYEGYTDETASRQKLVTNVFQTGDKWFRTGDLMRQDSEGFFYFVDRIGDTFRWKGENVSTLEVSDTIATCPGVMDVVVYGVSVPTHAGRAGMAALVVSKTFDLAELRALLAECLPQFARPLFLRIQSEIVYTGTFKQVKQQLVKDGFNPTATDDPMYLDSFEAQRYIRIESELFSSINAGATRL